MGFHDELGLSMGSEEARSGLFERPWRMIIFTKPRKTAAWARRKVIAGPRALKGRQVTPGFCADLLPQTVTAGAFIRELKYSIDLKRPSSSPTRGLHPRDSLAMDISGFL